VKILSEYSDEYRQRSIAANQRKREQEEYVTWNVDPLELMTVAQFEALLTQRFGPEYMEAVQYERNGGGDFVPCHSITLMPTP